MQSWIDACLCWVVYITSLGKLEASIDVYLYQIDSHVCRM